MGSQKLRGQPRNFCDPASSQLVSITATCFSNSQNILGFNLLNFDCFTSFCHSATPIITLASMFCKAYLKLKGAITSRSLFLANFTNYLKLCICSYRSHILSFRTFEDSMMRLRHLLHTPFSSQKSSKE